MKKSDNPRNNSRRSFFKKSVVASVAASNLTMFSGLVNTSESGSSGGYNPPILCKLRSREIGREGAFRDPVEGDYILIRYRCWVPEPMDLSSCVQLYCVDDVNSEFEDGRTPVPCGSTPSYGPSCVKIRYI